MFLRAGRTRSRPSAAPAAIHPAKQPETVPRPCEVRRRCVPAKRLSVFPAKLFRRERTPVKIDELLRVAAAFGASDLHCKAGSQPFMRIGGELRPISTAPRLTQEDTLDMAFSMMSNRQKQRFKE